MFQYGTIVKLKVNRDFGSIGTYFKILIEEGDDEIGAPRHALCHRIADSGKVETDYIYEIPWDDMEDVSATYMTESLNKKIEPLRAQIAQGQAQIQALEEAAKMYTRPTKEFLEDFRQAMNS